MKVKCSIARYGNYEFREVDIDLEEAVRKELESHVFSCGGFDNNALDSVTVDYNETAQMFVKKYL